MLSYNPINICIAPIAMTIKTKILYLILPQLPKIPEDLLAEADANLGDPNSPNPRYFDIINRPDGQSTATRRDSWTFSGTPLHDWFVENFPKPKRIMFRNIVPTIKNDSMPPHKDFGRNFVLIYNFDDYPQDVVFWKYQGIDDPFRGLTDMDTTIDYSQLEEIGRFRPLGKIWYLINAHVLHEVQGVSVTRRSIQIGFDDINVITELLGPITDIPSTKT